jgi:predicted ABC-type exoprotein transport system permease subunit
MRAFFPISRADRLYLALLVALAVVAFLPWSRNTAAGSLPVFAWLMVALMVLAPLVALVRLLLSGADQAGGEDPQ